jgi:copper transport protein
VSFSALWQDPSTLDTHSRKFDTVYAVRAYLVLALVAVLALALRRSRDHLVRPSRVLIAAAGVSTVALVATWPLVSHSAVDAVPLLASAANLLHSLAMAVWLGGLVVIVACLASPGRLSDDDRDAALVAFSRVALVAVGTLVATGAFMTWREVGSASGLVSTEFGRVLLAKLSAVAVLLLLGNVSRRWVARHAGPSAVQGAGSTPAVQHGSVLVLTVPARTASRLRRIVALEIVAAALVLAITAALVVIGPGL